MRHSAAGWPSWLGLRSYSSSFGQITDPDDIRDFAIIGEQLWLCIGWQQKCFAATVSGLVLRTMLQCMLPPARTALQQCLLNRSKSPAQSSMAMMQPPDRH
jgi:hypothetical protein